MWPYSGNVFPISRSTRTAIFKHFSIPHGRAGLVCSSLLDHGDVVGLFRDHVNYKSRVTVTKVKFCILAIWLNALFLAVLPVAGMKRVDFLFAYCYSHFVFPAIVLTVTYIVIFRTLSLKLRNIKRQVCPENTLVETPRNLHRQRRLAQAILLVLIAFYTCFIPYSVNVHLWFFWVDCERSASFLAYHFI